MVQLMNSGMERSPRTKKRLKMEADDSVEDLLGQFRSRSKVDSSSEKGTLEANAYMFNPLDEPSPLGLNLRKSPSLLDLIQAKLSQETASKFSALSKKDQKGTSVFNAVDKLKASNFPASILKIGSWEYKSRYEGDLVAKCYFAKHKLVWELLDGNLKNKIEIQWSDIVALKAASAEDGVGTLDVVLARQPLFFREINPQPKKHTLWQATADFTGGEASRYRRHFLQSSQGLLNKHFEKLIRCDPRLNYLSQQPDIVLEFPYFKTNSSSDESKEGFGLKSGEGPTLFSLGLASPSGAQSPSSNKEPDCFTGASEEYTEQSPSPSSVMETHMNEEIRGEGSENSRQQLNKWDQIFIPGIHPSMSVSDFVSYIGNCLSQQMTSNGPIIFSQQNQRSRDTLEEITQYLFGDSQLTPPDSDEHTVMSRVNSLCCLLQKDPCAAKTRRAEQGGGNGNSNSGFGSEIENQEGVYSGSYEMMNKPSGSKRISMARNDSVGEFLLNLPRIASLPQFFFNLLEDSGDR